MTADASLAAAPPAAATSRIAVVSLVGTTIEFYDFYIYGTAAALVFGQLFFPSGAREAQTLAAFLTFGIAFLARPLGAFIFGHFGDRIGRKSTLVASMLVMGLSTVCIGLLPGYAAVGAWAPLLLCLLRFGQGIGLGGEWGGAALLATESAPAHRRAWFGMFPQLGPSVGFLLSNGMFLALALGLSDAQFLAFGWRIPFLASIVLVSVGLYVRVQLSETPAFQKLTQTQGRVELPFKDLLQRHGIALLQGSLAMVVCYAIFYISTVFALDYATHIRHIPRQTFLTALCVAVVAMAAATPISAALADRFGRRPILLLGSSLAIVSGFLLPVMLGAQGQAGLLLFPVIQLAIMGFVFAPMGAFLPELFPTAVRYTGSSAAYSLGGILGASLAPYAATLLLAKGGLAYVGYYVSAAGLVSLLAILSVRETGKTPTLD
ncbi:MAG TPA: MFS transporter [Methylovirgula sp.]|nr:MFS transporter [Methylovirgula sp.]